MMSAILPAATRNVRRIGCPAAATAAASITTPEFPSSSRRPLGRRRHSHSTVAPPSPFASGRRIAAAATTSSSVVATTRRRLSTSSRPPKLAHEWIEGGKVVPPPSPGGAEESEKEVIVFLHGLLGNAKNLRTPAKKLTQKLPHLRALLLDIRGHGNSSTRTPSSSFARPHDFQSCVRDVVDTLAPLGLVGPRSPGAICGHSLGGRIALQYSHHLRRASSSSRDVVEPPKQTWVLDCVPGRADPSVHGVLRSISSLPTPVPSKAWAVDTLVKEHKMNKGVAMWIATNLRDGGDGTFEWAFDLGVANELVDNFPDQDFVGMIRDVTREADPDDGNNPGSSTVHLVMAGRNESWSEEVVSELRSIPSFRGSEEPASSSASSFRMHRLDEAGHWVHVDDLEGLVKLMADGYATADRR